MKYVYSIDYQITGTNGFMGTGHTQFSLKSPMTSSDLEGMRKRLLETTIADWKRRPDAGFMRPCPITQVSILNIWGGSES